MSYTSTSTSFSISAVGTCDAPYSEWIGTPVAESTDDDTLPPASTAPRMPCSNANSAVSRTPGACASRSIVLRPARSRPDWFVTSPTRLPRTSCSESRSSTSTPGTTPALGAASLRTGCAPATCAASSATTASVLVGVMAEK